MKIYKKRCVRNISLKNFRAHTEPIFCLNTRALRIYLAPGYSTGDFLLAWTEFESDCGIPRRVHSDRGSQIVSAAGQVEGPEYDWEQISRQSKGQTTWSFCPSGA